MSSRMRTPEMVDLERSLRALADEDRGLAAPPHVQSVVMHTWAVARSSPRRRRSGRRPAAAILALGSMAAGVALVVMYRATDPGRPRPAVANVPTAPRHEARVVFVADPILDASATKIVRVRVPRTALVTLGIPLVEPDGDGLVDLEMLVGDDGVAQTIRRAVPAAARRE